MLTLLWLLTASALADVPPPRPVPQQAAVTPAPKARLDAVLRSNPGCEIDALALLVTAAQTAVNAPVPSRPATAEKQAVLRARDLVTRANDLYARQEVALAYARAREARKELRLVMEEVWVRNAGEGVAQPVSKLLACAGERVDVTAGVFRSHALVGPRTAWQKASERASAARMEERRGDPRLVYMMTEDMLHQLDLAITREWPETQ